MAAYPDGTLLQDQDAGGTYLVLSSVLHYVPTTELARTLGYPTVPLTFVPHSVIAAMQMGDVAHVPEGRILGDRSDGRVYVFSGGALHYIQTAQIREALGFPQNPQIDVSHDLIASLRRGADATLGLQSATGMALARVNDTVPLYIHVGSDFQTLTAQQLGNTGTSTDGFDALISPALLGFNGDVAALTELDGHLSAMDYTEGVFRSGNIDPIVADTQPFLDSGDSIINTPAGGPPAADPGGGPAPISNPPAPAPSPVIGGGGSGGGGGGGGRPDPCIEGDEYPFCGPDFPTK